MSELPDIALVLTLVGVVIRLVALVVVPANRRPSSAMAWLLAIFFIPTLGALLFALIGSPKLPRERRDKQRHINELVIAASAEIERLSPASAGPEWLASIVDMNRRLGAMPLLGADRAELLTDYDASLQAMTDAIRSARTWVHVEFYILNHGSATAGFFDAIEEAVARGVRVRVLFDHLGSLFSPGYRGTVSRLKATGASWRRLLPVSLAPGRFRRPDLRNHRKLLVVDGTVAFTGSQNIVERSYGKRANRRRGVRWQDLVLRVEGPAVRAVNALFVTDWYTETGELLTEEIDRVVEPATADEPPGGVLCQVVPSGPSFDAENNLRLFNSLIYNAQRRIAISSPYFVPDESLFYAVTTAVQRGVEVELFVSEIGDHFWTFHAQRSYYEQLLRLGVRIHLYPAPYILHAKHLSIDDEVAVVGSSNMDRRSFTLNLEISLMLLGGEFLSQLRAVEDAYRARSSELTLDEWLERPFATKVVDNLARLTSALQ